MSRNTLVLPLLAALVLAAPLAAQEFSLDFRHDPVIGREGQYATFFLDLTGQGPANNLTVSYTYTVGPLTRSGWETLFPNSKTVVWSVNLPDDEIYGSEMHGRITISYTHPYTNQVVEKSADIQVDENEFRPRPAFEDVRVVESEGGTHSMRITLSHQSAFAETVTLRTCCGTATAGSDFALVDQSVTFAPMQTEGEVRFQIYSDSSAEGPETFDIYADSSSQGGTVTIVEDDLQAVVSPDAPRAVSGEPFEIEAWLPEAAPGPFVTDIEIADESIVSFNSRGPRQPVSLGAAPTTLYLKGGLPGLTTITFTPASPLYSPKVVQVEVYGLGFEIDAVPQPLRPGDEVTTIVRMSPAGEAIALSIDVQPAGVIETSTFVPVAASGTGELTIKALRPGTAGVSLTSPTGRLVAYLEVNVEEGLGITGIAPNSGPSSGGTNVTITGTAFRGTCGVKFGHVAAAAVQRVDDHTIRATSPRHTAATVDLSVTCDGATATRAAAFTFTPVRTRAVRH